MAAQRQSPNFQQAPNAKLPKLQAMPRFQLEASVVQRTRSGELSQVLQQSGTTETPLPFRVSIHVRVSLSIYHLMS